MRKPRLLDFSAEWCRPCRMQAPIIHKLAEIFSNKIDFEVIDIDCEPKLADKFNIRAVPTIVILNENGEEIKRFVGFTTEEILTDTINKLLA